MPATLTAKPNPVVVPKGQSQGKTTLTWNGAEQGRCQLYEVVGGQEKLIAPIPDPGQPGEIQGSITLDISLGTHVYRLKRATAPKQVVASLAVSAAHQNLDVVDAVQFALQHTKVAVIPSQAILIVNVTPQADTALFAFRTALAAVPMVTIRFDNPDTGPLLTTRFASGKQKEHRVVVDRLPQETRLFFMITAGDSQPSKPSAVLRGSFRTGRVDAEVIFDKIVVDSDSDDTSEGDLTFKFYAGDAETRAPFDVPVPEHQEGLDDDEDAFIGESILIEKAPARIWAEVECIDDDEFFFPYPGEGLSPVGHLLGITGFQSTDNYDYTFVMTEFDTLEDGKVIQGMREIPFEMKTGNFPLAFTVIGRLRLNGARGVGFRMEPTLSVAEAAAGAGFLAVRAQSSGWKSWLVALGPDAVVYHKKRQRDKSGLPRDEWTPLGGRFEGSLAGVAVDETRLSLFALDADGAAFHKSYIDGEPPDAAWQPLGGAFVGSLGVTPGPRNHIELFGVDREGTAYHRSIDPTGCNTRDDWERIGANVTGELSPLYSQRAGVTVFTLGRDGSVAYKRLDGEEWQPGAGKWESLGGQFEGVLTARLLADGGVLLVVICSDRSVHTLNWSNYPEDRANQGWEAVGTIDSIFESLGREWKRASPPALEGSESTVEDKVEAEPLRARSHVAGKR